MPPMAERALAVSNWLLEKLSGTIPAEHRTAYSKLNTYNNEVQAVLNPDNDFERNEDGILVVSDRAMTDVFEAYIHDEITGSSHFGVWGVVLAWGRGLPDD